MHIHITYAHMDIYIPAHTHTRKCAYTRRIDMKVSLTNLEFDSESTVAGFRKCAAQIVSSAIQSSISSSKLKLLEPIMTVEVGGGSVLGSPEFFSASTRALFLLCCNPLLSLHISTANIFISHFLILLCS